MLHMRVLSPPEHTDAVRTLLLTEAGATHVTVSPGIAVQPLGDVVEADVAREAVDGLIGTLCDIGIDRRGGVTLEAIDTTLSDAADVAGLELQDAAMVARAVGVLLGSTPGLSVPAARARLVAMAGEQDVAVVVLARQIVAAVTRS